MSKTYAYKVYDPDNNYIGDWNDVVDDFEYSQEINNAGPVVDIVLARNTETLTQSFDNLATQAGVNIMTEASVDISVPYDQINQIGSGSTVELNYRVDVYVFFGEQSLLATQSNVLLTTEAGVEFIAEIGSPNGRKIFSGYISRYAARYGSTETTLVTLTSFGDELDNYVIEDDGVTTVPYYSQSPAFILKDILDLHMANGGMVTYNSSSIQDPGTVVTYEFRVNTTLDGIKKVIELAPADWFWWFDPANNIIYMSAKPTVPTHTFILGKHINSLNLERHIEDLVNVVYLSGGDDGTGNNLFIKAVDSASISAYRRGLERISDERVRVQESAEIIAQSDIDRGKDPRYRTTLTVQSDAYIIEEIKLGELVGFANFNNFIDALTMQIVGINYTPDNITLQLDSLLPSINKRVEDIRRNLSTQETINNPAEPELV